MTVVRTAVALAAFVAAFSASAMAAHFPTIGGESHPAWIGNGDGSVILGGLDGTGRGGQLGHIRWTTWSSKEAVGLGAEWDRCMDYRGCSHPYTLRSRRLHRIVASDPVRGVFTHLLAFGCEVWGGAGVGYYPASVRTCRP
jgi:hypothetical protein